MSDTDFALHRKVDSVERKIGQLDTTLSAVGNEVLTISSAQRQAASDLAQLRADFLAYTRESERRDNIQRAEVKIGVLQDELEHQFGHYKVVRRTATGILQAFDIGLVSEDVARNVAEELMIQSPRYWLAPALVGLAAWAGDDRELCERAVGEAYRRSPHKTALLFMLVLRRQGRKDSATRWLKHYLNTQDPTALTREFAVILEAAAQNAFGPAGRAVVDATLSAWRDALSDPAAEDRQVARWRIEVESLRPGPATADFPALSAVSPEWPQLSEGLRGAEGHALLLDKYQAIMTETPTPQDRIEDAMDDILDQLVSEYDGEELPKRRELSYQQAVVDRDGDLDAARSLADVNQAALDDTRDYLTIQSQSALDPAGIGVSRATQQVAVAACRDWFGTAHEQATGAYRGQLPLDVAVQFSGSHNIGASAFQLPPWTGQLSRGMPELEQSLGAHWDQHTEAYVRSLAFDVTKKLIVPIAVVLLVAVIGIAANPLVGVLLTLVVGGIWGFKLYREYQQSFVNQENARQELATWKQQSLTQLRAAGAELTDWTVRFQTADERDGDVRTFVSGLATAGHAATPFERRDLGGMSA